LEQKTFLKTTLNHSCKNTDFGIKKTKKPLKTCFYTSIKELQKHGIKNMFDIGCVTPEYSAGDKLTMT